MRWNADLYARPRVRNKIRVLGWTLGLAVWLSVGCAGLSSLHAETSQPLPPLKKSPQQPQLLVLSPQTKPPALPSSLNLLMHAQFQPSTLRRRPEIKEENGRTRPLFLPLPAIASNPNKGVDFGILPVVLFFDKENSGRIKNILAPSLIFNTETGLKGAFRWLGYLPKGAKYQLIAIQSIDVDSDYIAEIQAPRIGPNDRFAAATGVRFERDPTKVFYGFGPDSRKGGKSGLIQRQYLASLSAGINLLEHFRVSYNERLRVALIEDGGGSQDPFIGDTFPGASGVRTWSTISARGLSVLFDTRDSGATPTRGYFGMVGIEISQQALGSEQSFTRVYGEAKAFIPWPNTQWISAVRVFSSFIDNGGVPHYEQSVLGGKDFRGFPSGRFVDRGVFTVNLEERIQVIRLELLRVPFDVEAAPFVEFGQVFNDLADIEARRLQVSYGLGIRAVVRPDVVGKIDIGVADEGLNIRVGLDYPF